MGEAEEENEGLDFMADCVRSSHAIEYLAKIYDRLGREDVSERALRSLAEKWDPIRRKYWEYRIKQIKENTGARKKSV